MPSYLLTFCKNRRKKTILGRKNKSYHTVYENNLFQTLMIIHCFISNLKLDKHLSIVLI